MEARSQRFLKYQIVNSNQLFQMLYAVLPDFRRLQHSSNIAQCFQFFGLIKKINMW